MGSIRALVLCAWAVVASSGCVLQPYEGQVVEDNETIPVSGFAQSPGSRISVQLLNGVTGAYEEVATATSGTIPAYPAGWFDSNSPTLYLWSTTVTVGPRGPRWMWGGGTDFAKLRAVDVYQDMVLVGGDLDSVNCFFTRNTRTSDFFTVASECGWNNDATTLLMWHEYPIP